jgi:hypothetical protein
LIRFSIHTYAERRQSSNDGDRYLSLCADFGVLTQPDWLWQLWRTFLCARIGLVL